MVPSRTRGVLSLVQVTEVAGPPVEVQTRVSEDLSYLIPDILIKSMSDYGNCYCYCLYS